MGFDASLPETPEWKRRERGASEMRELALQLRFHVSAPCLGLMCSSPERPSDDELRSGSLSSKSRGDAADFLHGPADERWAGQRRVRLGVFALRRIVFGGGVVVLA